MFMEDTLPKLESSGGIVNTYVAFSPAFLGIFYNSTVNIFVSSIISSIFSIIEINW